jgi:uncharacterized protein
MLRNGRALESKLHEERAMLNTEKATKVTIYSSEGDTNQGEAAYTSIVDFLFHHGVSGVTVLKGVAGFGVGHKMHTESIVEISDHLPIKIEFIESPEKVDSLLEETQQMCGCGLIEIRETSIVKVAQDR